MKIDNAVCTALYFHDAVCNAPFVVNHSQIPIPGIPFIVNLAFPSCIRKSAVLSGSKVTEDSVCTAIVYLTPSVNVVTIGKLLMF